MTKILIVDDDIASCRTLQLHFQSQGFQVAIAHSVAEGLKIAAAERPGLIVLDIRMPGRTGLDGLPDFKEDLPNTSVIMVTAFHDMDTTIQAMKHAADDYIHKPIDINELDEAIGRALARRESGDGDMSLAQEQASKPGSNTMVGRSWAMKEVFKSIGLVAPKPVTVLITGESGTGKELVAKAIHNSGDHPRSPFVAVNCAALVETLLESDLFGHEKGAFTGAVARQAGKFAIAEGGTIFLDEVGELTPTVQAKLLRVLQEKEYIPVGGSRTLTTHARVIAAANVNLQEKVEQGVFREDLYYRLKVVTIHMPPLRERKEDLLDLVQVLLARINRDMRRKVSRVAFEVMDALQEFDWPGNVRELENVLIKAVALCPGDMITLDLLPDAITRAAAESMDAVAESVPVSTMSLEEVEKRHVMRVLEVTKWHRGQACEILGVSRPRLRRMIRQYGLIAPDYAAKDDA